MQPDDDSPQSADNPATKLIRNKLASLYAVEPSAEEEIKEINQNGTYSKHQAFIDALNASGKPLDQIQVEWHNYYQSLPDNEKHEVWTEFYSNYSRSAIIATTPKDEKPPEQSASDFLVPKTIIGSVDPSEEVTEKKKSKSVADLKGELLNKVNAGGKLSKKHHIQSFFFSLAIGLLAVGVVMFGFFNERFITPFITPGRQASSTPIIIDPNQSDIVGPEPKIIIPKINVDAPLVTTVTSYNEDEVQAGLESGVVLYPFTGEPGQKANPVFFGHSSNNIFNDGKYKFVFVLLNKLSVGDTFIINYDSKRYVYRIFERKIVQPNEVGVLSEQPKTAMVTLITCEPPGTSDTRLVLQAEQISPDPNANIASTAQPTQQQPEVVPGNPKSLWNRLTDWLF